MGRRLIDITGKVFGKWTVIEHMRDEKWLCRCECSRLRPVRSSILRSGGSKGCMKCRKSGRETHGLYNDPDRPYYIWQSMLNRCENLNHKQYKHYGGRGIFVCERWHDIKLFWEDMGSRPSKSYSIDRIDNNDGYSPDNCRWATQKEQSRNTRRNVYLEVNGVKKIITEWAEEMNVKTGTIWNRLRSGWSEQDAVLKPVATSKGVK